MRDNLAGQRGYPFGMPLGRIPLDDHVAPLDVTQAPQFSKKQTRSVVATVLADQGGGNDRRDDCDPAAFCWLCAGGGRPRGSGTQQNHKSASLHAALVKREPRNLITLKPVARAWRVAISPTRQPGTAGVEPCRGT